MSVKSKGLDLMYNIIDDSGIVAQGYVASGKTASVSLASNPAGGHYTIVIYTNYLNRMTRVVLDYNTLMASGYGNNFLLTSDDEYLVDCTLSITGTSVSGDLNNSIIV